MKIKSLFALFLCLSLSSCATIEGVFDKGILEDKVYSELPYRVLSFKPNPDERFPLVLALHGMGGSGEDYVELWREEATRRRIMVVAPSRERAYENKKEDLEIFYGLLEKIQRDYPVDPQRVYIAGVSAGALLSEWLVIDRPAFWKAGIFAAYVPSDQLLARANEATLPPLLFIHGARDLQFESWDVNQRVKLLKIKGVSVENIEDANAAHEQKPEWSTEILNWLENQSVPGPFVPGRPGTKGPGTD